MTEPIKTAENPHLELAIADAMRENIESTRIMDHVEPLKRVVEKYAAQQVAAERERIKNELKEKIKFEDPNGFDYIWTSEIVKLIDSL